MARTESTMMPLGTSAPDFELPDVNGNTVSLPEPGEAKAILVIFMCNHCPFVKHIRGELVSICRDYQERGLAMFGINSNNVETHPADSPEMMKKEAEEQGYEFPYLYDESQEVAKAYSAACTPDFFLFDGRGKLAYRGQLDDSRPDNGVPVTGADLRSAIDALLQGQPLPPPEEQKPSVGCNIKWKPGNEPDYAK